MNFAEDIADWEGMLMAYIRKGHSIKNDGLVFVYQGDYVSVLHNTKEVGRFSVLAPDGQRMVNTQYDLEYEVAWWLKQNNAC